MIERWGSGLLDATGEIQRRALGRIVFADAAALKELEAMVFPFIGKRIHEEIVWANQDCRVLRHPGCRDHDGGRLGQKLQSGDLCRCPKGNSSGCLRRQRHWTAEELDSREHAQMAVEEKTPPPMQS